MRAARASAALEGADRPAREVRALVGRPSGAGGPDPVGATLEAALRATAAAAELGSVLATAPLQAVAKVHLAVAGGAATDPDLVGRPRRTGVPPGDLVGLGPALSGPELAERLDALGRLILGSAHSSAVVLVAVVQGELLVLRPFGSGNGLVARAVSRALVVARGLDPTGVAVPEVGLLSRGATAYVRAAGGYASGTPEGVAAWVRFVAEAIVVGAAEGGLVGDAVVAGRLP